MEFYSTAECYRMIANCHPKYKWIVDEVKALNNATKTDTFNEIYLKVKNITDPHIRNWLIRLIDSIFINLNLANLNYDVCGGQDEKKVLLKINL